MLRKYKKQTREFPTINKTMMMVTTKKTNPMMTLSLIKMILIISITIIMIVTTKSFLKHARIQSRTSPLKTIILTLAGEGCKPTRYLLNR